MNIKWYGHSTFLFTAENGLKILTDPCGPGYGYTLGGIGADIVTVSHDHGDHNYLAAVAGAPKVLRTPGVTQEGGARITGIATFHDDAEGRKRGKNLIFLFELDGLRVAHLGDLGAIPPEDVFDALGKLDVLLAPIGGTYTIGPKEASEIAGRTCARVFIPMHYQTPQLRLGATLLGIDALLKISKGCKIHKLNQSEATVTPESLGEDRLLVLDYTK